MKWADWMPITRGWADVVSDHAPACIRLARLAFFALALAFVVAAWTRFHAGSRSAPAKAGRGRSAFPLLALCFAAILVYQATWQLAGFIHPGFLTFIRQHSHRAHSPAGAIPRGRILAHDGTVLAADTPTSVGTERRYPLGPDAAHLIGYADRMYGLSGVEEADDRALTGLGAEALGDWRTFGQAMLDHARTGGGDLRLTLDAALQTRAAKLLAGRPGAVVGIRPSDGAILVLVSSPSFDPGSLAPARAGRQVYSPMFNRALQGRYAPGSTFKIITACKAAEAGFRGTYDCPASGFLPPGHSRPIRDHEYFEAQRRGGTWGGQGSLDLEEAFARSSNVFFARLGSQLGATAMDEITARFCFNRPIPVFTGSSGSVAADASTFPTLSPKSHGELAQVSIGQGSLAVTPLQMALVAAAIANRGAMMAPRCGASTPPATLSQATTPAAAQRVARLMRGSVLRGTSRAANIPEVEIAGKTGTAQNASEKDNAWFVCFAPYQHPKLALAVVVEGGGFGAQTALPVAVDLMKAAAKANWGEAPPAAVPSKPRGGP